MTNQIYNENCLETMKRMKDNSIDLILTDPPYGLGLRTVSGGSSKNTQTKFIDELKEKQWDNEVPSKEIFDEMFRVSKNQIIWGGNYFDLPPTRTIFVWDKMTYVPTMSQIEIAWTSFDSPARLFKVNSNLANRVHPTQKAEKIIEYCIREVQEKHDIKTIYDPFSGSGTTLVVAKSLGLNYIGSELDKDYYEITVSRLKKVQMNLF